MNDREVQYVGAGLKLACPAPVGGEIVSVLVRGGGDAITYQIPGGPRLPWPPDPTLTEYGEPCFCQTCAGRLVGAGVEELRMELAGIAADPAALEDTYELGYLESARDVVVRASQQERYGLHRNIATFTDTYERTGRRVAVRYDPSLQEVEEVTVVAPPTGEFYPATIAGALTALRG